MYECGMRAGTTQGLAGKRRAARRKNDSTLGVESQMFSFQISSKVIKIAHLEVHVLNSKIPWSALTRTTDAQTNFLDQFDRHKCERERVERSWFPSRSRSNIAVRSEER